MPVDEVEERLCGLDALLGDLIELFRAVGETHWLAWADRGREQLRSCDSSAFDTILGGIGGMGSLNDLLLLRVNGHIVAEAEEDAVNRRLKQLTRAVWEEANCLRHLLRAH